MQKPKPPGNLTVAMRRDLRSFAVREPMMRIESSILLKLLDQLDDAETVCAEWSARVIELEDAARDLATLAVAGLSVATPDDPAAVGRLYNHLRGLSIQVSPATDWRQGLIAAIGRRAPPV